ncbi:MAG: CRISPR-associated endonuclease Cas2 [Clostridiaceae bacterium]|jgi:CRISPR-associated protein Cas2|nr:CRISPR-associated endonuclease Cas2 [Clostridiaceae bacterium]
MLVLVTYDVNTESPGGKKRLHRVAKICQNFGQRVQNSVFECLVDPTQLIELKYQIQKEIDNDKDSIRYYYLGSNWKRRVEHIGSKKTYDPEGLIIT